MVSRVKERDKETLHSDINKETPKYCHKTQEHGYDQGEAKIENKFRGN